MRYIEGNCVNELCIKAFKEVNEHGKERVGVNGKHSTLELSPFVSSLTNPLNRYLHVDGRSSNIYAAMAETFWVMSGSNVITGWMSDWLHRAVDYSDDGVTWNRAYGPMLYKHNQLEGVINYLRDNNNTRQAVLSIYEPNEESYQGTINKVGNSVAKDKSCNNLLYFSVDPETNCLDLTIANRSNDVLWGAYSINLFEFTFIQEIVADAVGLKVGRYNVMSNNTHVYTGPDVAWTQFNNVIDKGSHKSYYPNDSTLRFVDSYSTPTSDYVGDLRCFFTDVINSIENKDEDEVRELLSEYKIYSDNKIQHYTWLMYCVYHKMESLEGFLDLSVMDTMLVDSIKHSKFTTFKVQQ